MEVEHRRRFREQTFARLDNRHVHAAAPVAPQDLAERLHALEPAPDDHHPRGLSTFGEPLEAPADAVALLDGLEGERVLDDTLNAPGRVHPSQRHDQCVVADGGPTPGRDRALDRVDLRYRVA